MRRIGIALAAVAGFLATADLASAAGGCGSGWRWDGYRCVRYRPIAPAPRYYAPPAPRGYYAPRPRRGYNPCGAGWSLQDGICKPYRGY